MMIQECRTEVGKKNLRFLDTILSLLFWKMEKKCMDATNFRLKLVQQRFNYSPSPVKPNYEGKRVIDKTFLGSLSLTTKTMRERLLKLTKRFVSLGL